MTRAMQEELRHAGLEMAWASPGHGEPHLRDVVHVTPSNIDTDLRPVLARAEARFVAAGRRR